MSGNREANAAANRGVLGRWLPVALWMALIFSASGIEVDGGVARIIRHQDKLIHIVEYGVLGLLLVRATFTAGSGPLRYWACIGAAVLVGALDELIQSFVPWRVMDWKDLAADAVGAVLFVWLWLRFNGAGLFVRPSAPSESEY